MRKGLVAPSPRSSGSVAHSAIDGESPKHRHERPKGRPGGTGALRQHRAGAIVRGMGSVCGGGG